MPGAYLWAYDPVNKKWLKVPCATDGTLKVEITNMKFWQLEDTPNEYTGQAGKGLRVKSSEDGLEFVALALDPHGNEAHNPDMLPLDASSAINAYMSGNKWLEVTPSGIVGLPKQSACYVYLNSSMTFSSGAPTKVPLDTVVFDVQSEFSTTNSRWTASEDGKYMVVGYISYSGDTVVADKLYYTRIHVNGNLKAYTVIHSSHSNALIIPCIAFLDLAAGDYVELYANHNAGTDQTVTNGAANTWIGVIKVT